MNWLNNKVDIKSLSVDNTETRSSFYRQKAI